MLIFDQLNKADRHLRALSWGIAAGLLVLLIGLWWVQVVRSRAYVEDQRNQSYRTVRVPAPRGRILDRDGLALADNRPSYSISLYLEDRSWRDAVQKEYKHVDEAARQTASTLRKPKALEKFLSWFGYEPSLTQPRKLTTAEKAELGRSVRYSVTSNIVWQLGVALRQPLVLTNEAKFHQHYDRRRALPMPILANLNSDQIARFQEQSIHLPGVDMEMQPVRVYPQGTLAAQVVGCLTHFDDSSAEGELASFNYHLPDFRGYDGIEAALDSEIRGRAGAKAVLVNNLGYRQSETVLSPIEAGKNVTLTIDIDIQRAAEKELRVADANKPNRGAAVVLDVRTGEIIAMASVPTYDPRDWVPRLPPEIWNTYTNDDIAPMRNRCVYGYYFPGSTFKTVVALAGLEAGVIDPEAIYPSKGYYQFGKRIIDDTAGPGDFNFRRAFKKSSNPYFIAYGLKVGKDAIIAMGERLHFGERTGIPLSQDSRGILPTQDWIRKNLGGWHEGDTINLSIGQGFVDVTPLQMAVATAAVANGGKVLWPQLTISTQAQDALIDPATQRPVRPQIRDHLPVSTRTLSIIQSAMLADTEDADGTGTAARVEGYRVCGKTGTAQVFNRHNKLDHHTVWFASYAPYEDPRYAVVVMMDYGKSGGASCAPAAGNIYRALKYRDERGPSTTKNSVVLR